ncbi:hypothetical protein OZD68_02740, partial [Wolbachia endosymbiont of Drosophila bicornuta]
MFITSLNIGGIIGFGKRSSSGLLRTTGLTNPGETSKRKTGTLGFSLSSTFISTFSQTSLFSSLNDVFSAFLSSFSVDASTAAANST